MIHFQNKVAVVTGGASGIGQALCEELALRGAVVIVADIDSHRAQQVASAIAAQGGRAESAEVDLADAKQMEKLVEQTVSRHERLDYFFNKEYLKRLPWRLMMEPGDATRAILRGVARNRAIIVCPWHGRLVWWCHRHFPWLLSPLWRMTVREWRTLRVGN